MSFFHNFTNIPCYAMSEVSFKRFDFALFDDGLTLKLAFIVFCLFKLFKFTTLHLMEKERKLDSPVYIVI